MNGSANEETALLGAHYHAERRGSDWTGLSPAVPHITQTETNPSPPTALQTVIWNASIVIMVCAAGLLGWFLGETTRVGENEPSTGGEDALAFNVWGQVFGYLCAVFYIASRVPQLILNYRRKTTDGLSMLFFIFACLGNVTYVLSIFAFEPQCERPECKSGEAARIYGKYMLVNLSWLAGALVTLLMDLIVFVQYFHYSTSSIDQDGPHDADLCVDGPPRHPRDETAYDHRPLLQRGDSSTH
ncbi:hypothetical protein E4U54_005776 [Claviceps lovelessii]|nr:hypothetical protein E4U54_005776 [Claviceps lovelessii]